MNTNIPYVLAYFVLITLRHEHRLRVFEKRVLRKLFDLKEHEAKKYLEKITPQKL
jgi:hypothetical protein